MLTRRRFLRLGGQALAVLPMLSALPAVAAPKSLVFAGPPAPLSLPLARLGDQPGFGATVEMRQWRNPDIMRSWLVSGEVQVSGVPANAAAILYNKGLPVRLLDVNNGGILSLLTRDPAIRRLEDVRGKKVLLFYRGDIPDMITRFLAQRQGIDLDKDAEVAYAGSPFEALQMLLSKRADTVLLPEPAATAAELKGKGAGMAFTRIALQDVWREVTGTDMFLPLGGTVCQASLVKESPDTVREIEAGMGRAVEWINAHPAEAGKAYAGLFGLQAPVLQKSLERFPLRRTPAREARAGLEFYFKALMEMSPKLVGGKLPDEGFYLG